MRLGKRIIDLGPKNLLLSLNYRLRKRLFRLRFYKKALILKANHTWPQVGKKLGVRSDFETYFKKLKGVNTVQFDWLKHNDVDYSKQTSQAIQNCFAVLGSETECFENGKIEWQKDFKTIQLQNTHKILQSRWNEHSNIFYQYIKITSPDGMKTNEYNPDVKVPWELSRFQHIFDFCMAYQQTNNTNLPSVFAEQIESWINQNPYLLGANWICPMEVSIRSINWIIGFHYFKNASLISIDFWEKFVCSLFDHMIFIENNWEWSDRPNNHYLADLIGYIYLCHFFSLEKKKEWAAKKLLGQFFQQVQPDGTAYEGSTNYHKLDTEIFTHFKFICESTKIMLPESFYIRFKKMEGFLHDCSDTSGKLAQIGDNDSGKIVCGIKTKTRQQDLVKTYPCFGLTIVNTKTLHLTFRHATFNSKQPTGHFHHDQLSLTLSLNGDPILVDPGTYVYTANPTMRNLLRSAELHNTFHTYQKPQNTDLFKQERDENAKPNMDDVTITNESIAITGSHKTKNYAMYRKLVITKLTNEIKIEDYVKNTQNMEWTWSLNFAPEIELEKINKNTWKIKKKKNHLLMIQSMLEFREEESLYSSEYGKIEKNKRLVANKNLSISKTSQVFLRLY